MLPRLYKETPKKANVRRKITPLDVSANSMYTIFPLFLKVMYRIWCHHLSYMRLQRIALNCSCQTFVLARFFSISGVVDEEEANWAGQLNELFCFDRSSLLTSLA